MLCKRIIPRLDIKGPNVVKGVHLEGLRIIGDPNVLALEYEQAGADEIIFIDTVASLYGRNNLAEVVQRTSNKLFIPLTVGGGIRTLEDIRLLLKMGADKVSINTAAVKNPDFISEAAETYGSQCIVVTMEVIKMPSGRYELFIENGRQATGIEAAEFAALAERKGAGELLLVSVDRDGTKKGFDLKLVRRIAEAVNIPVIASGGAAEPAHISAALTEGKAEAVSCASIFHYKFYSIAEVKKALADRGLKVRLEF